jgi:hypothetical protein
MSKPNGITARKKNLSISVWSADNGIGIELKSVRKKTRQGVTALLRAGRFYSIQIWIGTGNCIGFNAMLATGNLGRHKFKP